MTRYLTLVLLLIAAPAAGQDRPAPALDFGGGWTGFADDGIVSEGVIGASARFYLTPRISIGPEFTHTAGESHSHQVLTGNLTVDLRRPAPGGTPRVTPYIVVGGGLFHTRESFFGESYSSSEGAFTAGGGVRVPVSDRVQVGADARIGWEPHLRLTGFVTARLGR